MIHERFPFLLKKNFLNPPLRFFFFFPKPERSAGRRKKEKEKERDGGFNDLYVVNTGGGRPGGEVGGEEGLPWRGVVGNLRWFCAGNLPVLPRCHC